MRLLSLLIVLAVIGAAAFAYDVKYRTKRLAQEAALLEQTIANEQNLIMALHAEWSTLNQPARLQALAARHLPEFKNSTVTQIALAYELPERPLDLGKFIGTLDAQPGLETPLDKQAIPIAVVKPPAQKSSNISIRANAVPVMRSSRPKSQSKKLVPMSLMPVFN